MNASQRWAGSVVVRPSFSAATPAGLSDALKLRPLSSMAVPMVRVKDALIVWPAF